MTTDVALPDDSRQLAVSPVSQMVAGYAADLRQCMGVASEIVDTEIVPPSFWPSVAIVVGDETKVLKAWEWDPRRKHPRESVEDYQYRRHAAIATTGGVIHVGATLGHKSYYQSITGIYFVGGRPALMSEEMRAQVLHAGHHLRVTTRTPTIAVVEALRRGDKGEPRQYMFTIEQAEQAGYVPEKGPNAGTDKWGKPKKGGNPKYLHDPATMLVARATTIACRLEFPDVIRGMAAAELVDDDRSQPIDVTATVQDLTPERTSAAAILARAEQAAPAPVPTAAAVAPVAAAPPEPEVTRAVLPASHTMMEVIKGLFEMHGIAGRSNADKAARLAVFGRILGTTYTAPPALTEDEARLVRDNLIGAAGKRLVADVLGRPDPTAAAADPGHLDDAAAVDEAETGQDYDPTTESTWARDEAGA